jgi:tetrahydromethanopterin S-methyltransferase subunit G
MKNKKLNYEEDTHIDDSALDIEWLEQPKLMAKYTRHEAETKRRLDKAKERLDIIEASLYQKIVADPQKYEAAKTTEGAIQKAIIQQDDYIEATEEKQDAQYAVNMAKSAVRSMYMKKEALENLVQLFGQQYFAGPKMPRDLSKKRARKEQQKETNKSINISRNK